MCGFLFFFLGWGLLKSGSFKVEGLLFEPTLTPFFSERDNHSFICDISIYMNTKHQHEAPNNLLYYHLSMDFSGSCKGW